ncbi:MAG: hypothetical protein HPY64_12970 [Anaerolineae bacterium]|nr:hypothetical protein [Anaerolineae bacterium]
MMARQRPPNPMRNSAAQNSPLNLPARIGTAGSRACFYLLAGRPAALL